MSLLNALGKNCGIQIRVRDYHQHATGAGSDAQAVSFIEAETANGKVLWGVGIDSNIVAASLKAVTSAAIRAAAAKRACAEALRTISITGGNSPPVLFWSER